MLQQATSDSDSDYIGVRRLLLFRKAESGVRRRLDWRCNRKGYVAYRNYIHMPRNWESILRTLFPCFSRRHLIPIPITSAFDASFSFAKPSLAPVADWIGDAIGRGMWPIVITSTCQEIGNLF
ncbi:hypothetical protein WN943_024809 [Citrus x changshan-huyou]